MEDFIRGIVVAHENGLMSPALASFYIRMKAESEVEGLGVSIAELEIITKRNKVY